MAEEVAPDQANPGSGQLLRKEVELMKPTVIVKKGKDVRLLAYEGMNAAHGFLMVAE